MPWARKEVLVACHDLGVFILSKEDDDWTLIK